MRPTLRAVLLVVLLVITPVALAAQTTLSTPHREILTRAEIEAAGIHRLSDLFAWIGTTAGTIEGFSWLFSIDELPTARVGVGVLSGPEVLVDGQPVDVDAHLAYFPELLPLTLQQIDSVEVRREPVLISGGIGTRGALHFHTSKPKDGPAARIWGRHGAETGDPGPYQYTPRNTPNVQRSGPDGSVALSFGHGRWDIEVATRYVETAVDDSVLRAIHGEGPSFTAYARGASLRAGIDLLGGRQQLVISSHNQLGDTYVPARGGIAHARVTGTSLGLSGGLILRGTDLAYHVVSNTLDSSFSTTGTNEFNRTLLDAGATVSRPFGPLTLGTALRYRRVGLKPIWPDPPRESADFGAPEWTLTAATRPGPRTARVALGGRFVGGAISPRFLAGVDVERGGTMLAAAVGYSTHLADDLEGREYGLAFPDSTRFDSRVLRASLGASRLMHRAVRLEIGGSAGIWRARPVPDDDPSGGDQGQRFLGVSAALRSAGTGPVQGFVSYRGMAARREGSETDYRSTAPPAHQLTGRLSYRPVASLRLGASLLLKSTATWPASAYALAEAFAPEALRRVDLSVEKWFWRGRLRTQLAVANALGQTERYHPAGGDFDLRYFVVGELALGKM